MGVIESKEITVIKVNADGTRTENTRKRTRKLERSKEPDYVKIYTNTWCDFKDVPVIYRQLLFSLAVRMSYADINDPNGGQLVSISMHKAAICKELNWKENMLQKGLKTLCEANAIRRVSRGIYQINPAFAGRGQWKYNATFGQGVIENIVPLFDFRKQ